MRGVDLDKQPDYICIMKHISVLVPECDPQLVCIVGCFKAFKMVNKVLIENGKQPMFDVQLVGLSKNMTLDDAAFSIRVHASLEEVKKTNLIIIPAMSWKFDDRQTSSSWLV